MKKLYYNGKILTMAGETPGSALQPEAVLVKDGIIAETGFFEDLKKSADRDTEFIDLTGRCLMPSFIDAHGHAVMDGQFSLFANLSGAGSFEDIVNLLSAHIKEHHLGKDDVLTGFGYDNNFLKEQAHPDKRVLDRVSTEMPIVIMHVSAHLACVNSKALEMAGITEDTPDPAGGLIGRMDDGKEPSGYLEEAGMLSVRSKVMTKIKAVPEDIMNSIGKNYIRHGITTIQDGATSKSDFELLKTMAEENRLNVDIVAYPVLTEEGKKIIHDNPEYCDRYRNHLKIGGYKMVLDGSPQGRTAWLSKPYENGEPGYCGYPWMKDEEVEEIVRTAVSENRQLLTHCNGDAASEQLLNAYEKILKETGNKNDLRPVMIHCQTVRNDQLDRMAKINMTASIFVGHVYYWGDVHVQNLGPERARRISPVKDALDRGIHVNFHQDTPVTEPDMLHSVWCAVNRTTRKGHTLGADQCISVYDALKAVTCDAAYEYFEENSKGSIEKGKRADLVILSDSPLEVDQTAIKDIQVLETIKDGETIYKK